MAEVTNVKEAVEQMKSRFNAGAAKGMQAVYQFDLTGDDGAKYNFVVNDGNLEVNEGSHEKPNITVTMAGPDFISMTTGKLNPQMAFMSGKLKIAGDMGLAMKMQTLFPAA
jgi:putative sterol carrier protein